MSRLAIKAIIECNNYPCLEVSCWPKATSAIASEGFWWAQEDLNQNYYFCRVKPTLNDQGQNSV